MFSTEKDTQPQLPYERVPDHTKVYSGRSEFSKSKQERAQKLGKHVGKQLVQLLGSPAPAQAQSRSGSLLGMWRSKASSSAWAPQLTAGELVSASLLHNNINQIPKRSKQKLIWDTELEWRLEPKKCLKFSPSRPQIIIFQEHLEPRKEWTPVPYFPASAGGAHLLSSHYCSGAFSQRVKPHSALGRGKQQPLSPFAITQLHLQQLFMHPETPTCFQLFINQKPSHCRNNCVLCHCLPQIAPQLIKQHQKQMRSTSMKSNR